MVWREWNSNPQNILVGDCVIRALTTVTGKDYDSILLDLSKEGLRQDTDFRYNNVWTRYINKNEEYDLTQVKLVGWNPTVNALANRLKHMPIQLVAVSNTHAVAIKQGDYLDTWDSGRRKVKEIFVSTNSLPLVLEVIKANGGTIKP